METKKCRCGKVAVSYFHKEPCCLDCYRFKKKEARKTEYYKMKQLKELKGGKHGI